MHESKRSVDITDLVNRLKPIALDELLKEFIGHPDMEGENLKTFDGPGVYVIKLGCRGGWEDVTKVNGPVMVPSHDDWKAFVTALCEEDARDFDDLDVEAQIEGDMEWFEVYDRIAEENDLFVSYYEEDVDRYVVVA